MTMTLLTDMFLKYFRSLEERAKIMNRGNLKFYRYVIFRAGGENVRMWQGGVLSHFAARAGLSETSTRH